MNTVTDNLTAPASGAQTPSPDVIAMIERLVAFPTVSRDSNLGLIEWARDYLNGLGIKSRLTYDVTSKKANLFATLGEGRKPGLILSGHTDVVPVEGQAWDRRGPLDRRTLESRRNAGGAATGAARRARAGDAVERHAGAEWRRDRKSVV